jgi:hypothetical protein
MNFTRAQHLQWAKERALELCAAGDVMGAWNSFASDLLKHPETADHAVLRLGMMLLMGGHLRTQREMRDFIEGCN